MMVNLIASKAYKKVVCDDRLSLVFDNPDYHSENSSSKDLWVNYIKTSLVPRMAAEDGKTTPLRMLRAAGYSGDRLVHVLYEAISQKAEVVNVQMPTSYEKFKSFLYTSGGKSLLVTFAIYMVLHVYGIIFQPDFEAWIMVYSTFFAFLAMSFIFPVVYWVFEKISSK